MKKSVQKRPRIKICGLTEVGEAVYLNEIHASYAGFVFWEKSKRNVSVMRAQEIYGLLDRQIKRVAVTVSPDLKLVKELEAADFDILQVHGELREEVVRQCSIPIWRACNLTKPEDIRGLQQHEKITGYVIDAGKPGSGRMFDWGESRDILEEMKNTVCRDKMFILAGGLNPQNVGEAVGIFQPDVVDVSSGVEGGSGKDCIRIRAFAEAVRGTDIGKSPEAIVKNQER